MFGQPDWPLTPDPPGPDRGKQPISSADRYKWPKRIMLRAKLNWLTGHWHRYDGWFFALYALSAAVFMAAHFYTSMLMQTGGEWSAPLDDVFIHFDYARATARGYPFEWSEGNGFSSGNTSLTYPFALAIGYWVGFRGLLLMQWAAIVAVISVVAFLVACGRLVDPVGRWVKYLLPPAVLSLGALNWSLWSGMENAFHLGIWALMAFGVVRLRTLSGLASPEPAQIRRWGWITGGFGALLFLTRPESAICVAAFGFYAAGLGKRALGKRGALVQLLRLGVPAVIALLLQFGANRWLTGEWSANGAIAKLALNNPYMPAEAKWGQYKFLLGYVILRNTQYHFSDALPYGWLVPLAALIPLFDRKSRGVTILLWVQVLGWLALVSLNGQVRWQNERYTMPAVAWLLVIAGLGVAVLIQRGKAKRFERHWWGGRLAVAALMVGAYWIHQQPKMQGQIWFFGRASRNIRDQHIVAGRALAALEPRPRRVLVGDAGALMYASDRPGLDIIGLGGYHDLPFARAGVHGMGASLELIERLDERERPDFMAIYPSWWGDLPVLFGEPVGGFPVFGNVICGGAEKVIYKADWGPLDRQGMPRSIAQDEHVVDVVDVADLVSERSHAYKFPHPSMGFVVFRVLPDPDNPRSGLFDAGRGIPNRQTEKMVLRMPSQQGRLIVRTFTTKKSVAEVRVDGQVIGTFDAESSPGWVELSLPLADLGGEEVSVSITPTTGEWVSTHVWVVERSQ